MKNRLFAFILSFLSAVSVFWFAGQMLYTLTKSGQLEGTLVAGTFALTIGYFVFNWYLRFFGTGFLGVSRNTKGPFRLAVLIGIIIGAPLFAVLRSRLGIDIYEDVLRVSPLNYILIEPGFIILGVALVSSLAATCFWVRDGFKAGE